MNRINRVTSILIQLQSKKIIPAKEIAQRFNISLRTVYRDIRTLEEAGIPIGSEAGKGYFLVEGFLLPPVMFTAAEVGALITAGKFLNCHGDESFIKDFDSARVEEEKKISNLLKKEIHLMGYEEVCTPVEMYSSGKASYVERNYKMIDDSDICVFYYDRSYSPKRKCISRKSVSGLWTSEKSGTSLAYKYAIKKKKQIINVFE